MPSAATCVDVIDEALRDDVVELLAGVELHGGRRIAADDAVDRGGARILADGDGGVDPLAARRIECIGEHLDRRRFHRPTSTSG